MLKVKNKLVGKVKSKTTLKGKLNNAVVYVKPELENLEVTPSKGQQVFNHENSYGYNIVTVEPIPEIKLQDKEITPTKETQNITNDESYDGLNQVTVNPIPDNYIEPSGTLEITENGEYDVKQYEKVKIEISGGSASILPSDYTQLKYISSSGTQYIDTDLIPDSTIGFDIKFITYNELSSSSDFGTIFGTRTNYRSNGYQLTTYSEGDLEGHFLYGGTRYNAFMTKEAINNISFKNEILTKADGTTEDLSGETTYPSRSIVLFANRDGSTVTEYSKTRLYSCSFDKNGTLIRNFIPAMRNSDNEIGLYDIVGDKFYANLGTGVFDYGTL